MATTANTITDAAYRKCGISSPTSAEDDDALEALNNMISLWGIDFLVPYVTRESFSLVIGQAEYTIGSGGDMDTVRPVSIANCYLKDSDNYSYAVKFFGAKDYNRIAQKTYEGKPSKFYYIPEYPLAKIIFNYEADETYTAYFEFWKNLTEFALLTTNVDLPAEYKKAMIYNLAIELAEDNSIELPSTVYHAAGTSLSLISRISAISRPAPMVRFDFNDGNVYNITTDE